MDFKAAAIAVHGTKYRYHKVSYTRAHEKVEVVCPTHGSFMVSPANHIHNKSGCPSCKGTNSSSRLQMTQKQFLNRARAKHGNKYDYSNTKYCGQKGKVTIRCKQCDAEFEQTGGSHLAGRGCNSCGVIRRGVASRIEVDELKRRLRAVKGSTLTTDFSDYVSMHDEISVDCRKCEARFNITPMLLLKGGLCQVCSGRGYSNMAITWIEYEAKRRRIKIQHALNGGEFKIPGTNYRADGYNKRSKTIFEFHGDVFHGNPKRFKPSDRPNPYNSKTAKEMHAATRHREKVLRALGYTVVVMWEKEWRLLRA